MDNINFVYQTLIISTVWPYVGHPFSSIIAVSSSTMYITSFLSHVLTITCWHQLSPWILYFDFKPVHVSPFGGSLFTLLGGPGGDFTPPIPTNILDYNSTHHGNSVSYKKLLFPFQFHSHKSNSNST